MQDLGTVQVKKEGMKVERVTATIKYSQDTGHGAWKAVEVGAEASVDESERWAEALAHLYSGLGQQLKALWASKKVQVATENPGDISGPPATRTTPATPPEHYCQNHQVEFKRYSRWNQIWFAHRLPDGKWCREKA